ncbi:MAG: UvrD-helicase domain-containing protein, partial [Saccharothrix sp.]|nr:UvrD-helicase domain-containing protein [Saccharothrix sp.]
MPCVAANRAPLLVRRVRPEERHDWDAPGRAVFEHAGGPLRVLGGPGTGKTTLLAELVAERVRAGAHPENVLVITANRRAAEAMRAHVTRLLTGARADGVLPTTQEPLVRTVHSYAFAVLRARSVRDGEAAPRLLSGPEQDAVVRELLAGDVSMGAPKWPDRLRPALTLPGFAHELRDLMLRATERGLAPEDLTELGRKHSREEWVAAGLFATQYEQVNLLASSGQGHAPSFDAAELVGSALLAFETDPDLLAGERRRVRHLLVDDAQHLDPLQYELLRVLGETAHEFVLAGDPDQAVFSFRGADATLLTDAGGPAVVLRRGHRMAPEVRAAVAR